MAKKIKLSHIEIDFEAVTGFNIDFNAVFVKNIGYLSLKDAAFEEFTDKYNEIKYSEYGQRR